MDDKWIPLIGAIVVSIPAFVLLASQLKKETASASDLIAKSTTLLLKPLQEDLVKERRDHERCQSQLFAERKRNTALVARLVKEEESE